MLMAFQPDGGLGDNSGKKSKMISLLNFQCLKHGPMNFLIQTFSQVFTGNCDYRLKESKLKMKISSVDHSTIPGIGVVPSCSSLRFSSFFLSFSIVLMLSSAECWEIVSWISSYFGGGEFSCVQA